MSDDAHGEEDVRFEDLPAAAATAISNTPAEPVGIARAAAERDRAAEPAAAPVPQVVPEEKKPSQPSPAATTSTPPDLGDAFQTKKASEYYYDESTQRFWLRNDAERWVDLSEGGFKRHLKKLGLRDKPNVKGGETISELDEEVSRIEKNCRVAYAGILAGYKCGIHTVAGRRVLVSEDPLIIEPAPGDWSVLRAFFEGLLVGQEPTDESGKTVTIDQRDHFYAWLQHVVQCFRDGRTASGLAFLMAGEPNCGKSFLALILRWILGGRVARPYNRMIGRDQFNKAEAESVLHLVDDDNQADTRLEARLKFGGELKMVVANNEFQLRTMHRDGFAVEVLRRLVVLVNLQLSRLMVLPPLDGDINDKVLLLKAYARRKPEHPITLETPAELACWPSPMPTRTEEEKETYRARVRAELPAFLWWLLNEYKMPSRVSGGRFVVRHWHHPALVSQLHELSPHIRIWELLMRSRVVFHTYRANADNTAGELIWRPENKEKGLGLGEWRGSASDLEKLLKSEQSKLTLDERREIPLPNWLGQRLQACSEHFGDDVCRLDVGRLKKTWILRPRKEDLELS